MEIVRLTDSLVDGVSPVFYTEQFHNMIEHHIVDLATSNAAVIRIVEPALANQYVADFFGLLTSLNVAPEYQWVFMRCNRLYSSLDYKSAQTNIVLPDINEIDELVTIYTSSANLNI